MIDGATSDGEKERLESGDEPLRNGYASDGEIRLEAALLTSESYPYHSLASLVIISPPSIVTP